MNERFDLAGRAVIITGGGKGIGKVYTQEFAKAGARVVAADVDGAAAKGVAEALAAEGFAPECCWSRQASVCPPEPTVPVAELPVGEPVGPTVTIGVAARATPAVDAPSSHHDSERSLPGLSSPIGSTDLRNSSLRPSGSKRPPSSSLKMCGLLRTQPSSSNERMMSLSRCSVV